MTHHVLPEPAHELGYTNKQLRALFTDAEFNRFVKWMDGQTVGLDEATGTAVVYVRDVQRFVRSLAAVR
jgi:hypothetical protein